MRFTKITNIWDLDLSLLSNVDRGRVYFERAKRIITETFDDPNKLSTAVQGSRFKRTYLIEKIGCGPAAAQQNPRIRSLLADTDRRLRQEVHKANPDHLPLKAVKKSRSPGAHA